MRHLIFLLIIFGLVSTPILSNPIDPKYFSEIQFSENGWIIELYPIQWAGELDSVYLTSTTDTAFVKPGALIPDDYCLLTQDSLLSILNINPANDTLSIYLNIGDWDFPDDQITIGDLQVDSSQSLSRILEYGIPGVDFWYIDNTPTLGFENDSENAMGTIHFQILDESGEPIPSAGLYRGIDYFMGDSVFIYTDSLGSLIYEAYARVNSFVFMKSGYYNTDTTFFVAPDSNYSVTMTMKMKESSIWDVKTNAMSQYYLSPAFPNPFNNSTSFRYHLPSDAFVTLSVYSLTGEMVAELFKGYRYAGNYHCRWRGTNVSSGIYVIRLTANRQSLQQKCLLIK